MLRKVDGLVIGQLFLAKVTKNSLKICYAAFLAQKNSDLELKTETNLISKLIGDFDTAVEELTLCIVVKSEAGLALMVTFRRFRAPTNHSCFRAFDALNLNSGLVSSSASTKSFASSEPDQNCN